MIKLNDFAKTLGVNPRALRQAIKDNPGLYPSYYKMPKENGTYMLKESEAMEWLESLKVT